MGLGLRLLGCVFSRHFVRLLAVLAVVVISTFMAVARPVNIWVLVVVDHTGAVVMQGKQHKQQPYLAPVARVMAAMPWVPGLEYQGE